VPDAATQARAIYDLICASCAHPRAPEGLFGGLAQAFLEVATGNPGLTVLGDSGAEVHRAFLENWFEWLKANNLPRGNFRVAGVLSQGAALSLRALRGNIPPDLMLGLVQRYRKDFSVARFLFPIEPLLTHLTKAQITAELRSELKKIYFQYAPSPTGKIQPAEKLIRDRIEDLTRGDDDKNPDPGRGPWSQIVFEEIAGDDPITRAGWESLLEHCLALESSTPSAKWRKRSIELVSALGAPEAAGRMVRWLELGPTPGQPPEARSPVEDSGYQKGIVWCLAVQPASLAAAAIGDFGVQCLRKVPLLGAVSQKVGLACVQALGAMGSREAVSQLTRLRFRVKYSVALKQIDKALHAAATSLGVSTAELEDLSVESYGLDAQGISKIEIGDAQARIQLQLDGRVTVAWHNADRKLVKSAPSHIKKAFPAEVRAVAIRAKALEETLSTQKLRLESALIAAREIPFEHWRRHFIDHPVLGFLGRRLIWIFRAADGSETSAIWSEGRLVDSSAIICEPPASSIVRLWHPLSASAPELRQWRESIFSLRIQQPFRQAFREFYEVTPPEKETRFYSNRFAGFLLRQHQFASLCRARGWDYRLMGAHFDGGNTPTKKLPEWKMHAEFYVDIPSDRDRSLLDSALGEESGTGINLFVGSDQIRFYRDQREIAIDEVPALVYSEVMRDADLFTSVCAVGADETWSDQGERGTGVLLESFDANTITSIVSLRIEMISRILPLTRFASQCTLKNYFIEVQGRLGTYRVQAGWGSSAARIDGQSLRWLKIPRRILESVDLGFDMLPIELDHRSEYALRTACLLAEDWKITDPALVAQLAPEP
jgi:hypothetical protein